MQRDGYDSPLLYDAEFQFFDVDFDGKDELLINDYYQGRCGNYYTVYEISAEGLILKDGKPFDVITNLTKFYPNERKIVNYLYDDSDDLYGYIISADGQRVLKTQKESTLR